MPHLEFMLRELFGLRRKMLKKSIRSVVFFLIHEIHKVDRKIHPNAEEMLIPEWGTKRPQELAVEEWCQLAASLTKFLET